MKANYRSLSVVILFMSLGLFAQHTTIAPKTTPSAIGKHKVMLIPFEPRMYMSEIDMYINKETKLTAKQIKYAFRDGVNEQLYKALKSNYTVVDLMEDTVKTKKDLENIYQYLNLEYMIVPDQANYTPPKKEKEKQNIEKGQLNVETNSDLRFMNAKLKNATLIPYLYGKYKTDIFIFVNQLDIKGMATTNPAEVKTTAGMRKIVVHYTIYTYDAKEINSGIAEVDFPNTINNPSKITSSYFSKAGQLIAQRLTLALYPPNKTK